MEDDETSSSSPIFFNSSSPPPSTQNTSPASPVPSPSPVHNHSPVPPVLLNNPSQSQIPPTRKSSRQSTKPPWFKDFITPTSHASSVLSSTTCPLFQSHDCLHIPREHVAFLVNVCSVSEPKNYTEASQFKFWVGAMKKELAALEANDTWDVTLLPSGHKAISSKWVYKIKHNPDGTIERYKVRLVIKGFHQKEGLDYKHTFAPVAKIATVRVIVAIATAKGWPLLQLDINNAFLHGYIDEDIYMKPPEGYHKAKEGQVCKLKRSLYSLKQASRQWNQELSKFLLELGYIQSKHDYSMFVKIQGDDFTVLLVYVDDVLITGNCLQEIQSTKLALHDKFTVKDLGITKYFLGIELCHTSQGTHLNQRKYILDLLQDTGVTAVKPAPFPLPQNLKLSLNKGECLSNPESYRRLVRRLLYLHYD